MGPVQVVVVGFENPTFSGVVLEELARLGESGVVRLIDVLVVRRTPEGAIETVAPSDAWRAHGEILATLLTRHDEGALPRQDEAPPRPAGLADVAASSVGWSLADAVPPATTAAIALIEHVWAAPLRAAIQRSGGRPLDETWLAPGDVEQLEGLVVQRVR